MNLYYNFASKQRRVQRLVTLFNGDEELWQRLKCKRRLRRKLFPWLSKNLQEQLDLFDFVNPRPPEDCVADTERAEIGKRNRDNNLRRLCTLEVHPPIKI
jgi:hypothetical protein